MMNQYLMNMNESLIQQQQLMMNMNQSLTQHQKSMNQINPQVFDLNNLPFSHPPVVSRSINRPIYNPQIAQTNRNYGMWAAPPQQQYQNPNLNPAAIKPQPSAFNKSLGPRMSNLKGKRLNNNKNFYFINNNPKLQHHKNRLKTRKFLPKKKFGKKNSIRSVPPAPRNTSSYIIGLKKRDRIALSPYHHVTPEFFTSLIKSPSMEDLGLDFYGSMNELVRFRSPLNESDSMVNEEVDIIEEDEGISSIENDGDVERKLDHDLGGFGIIYDPNDIHEDDSDEDDGDIVQHNVLEDRIDDDRETNGVRLEEENMILKEKLVLMEKELQDLRTMLLMERSVNRGDYVFNDVVDDIVNDVSENDSDDTIQDLDEEDFEGDNCEVFEAAAAQQL